CEAAHVALCVGGAELARNSREPSDQFGLCAWLQALRLCVLRNVAGDGQRAVGAPAFRMHGTLRNALAVLMGQLLDELIVLKQQRPARTSSQRVLVVGDRCAG